MTNFEQNGENWGEQNSGFSDSWEPLSPDEVLTAARAIAERKTKDEILEEQTFAELNGHKHQGRTPDELSTTLLVRTGFYMAKIQNPYVDLDPREIALSENGVKAYQNVIGDDGPNGFKNQQYFDNVLTNAQKLLDEESGLDKHARDEMFVKEFNAARQVAHNNAVSISEVYSDDELYAELIRQAYTPDEFADFALFQINVFTDNLLNQLALGMIRDEERATNKSLHHEAVNFQLNPEIQSMVKRLAKYAQESLRQVFVYKIACYWLKVSSTSQYDTDSAMELLTPEHKDAIRPTQETLMPTILSKLSQL